MLTALYRLGPLLAANTLTLKMILKISFTDTALLSMYPSKAPQIFTTELTGPQLGGIFLVLVLQASSLSPHQESGESAMRTSLLRYF